MGPDLDGSLELASGAWTEHLSFSFLFSLAKGKSRIQDTKLILVQIIVWASGWVLGHKISAEAGKADKGEANEYVIVSP
jgi:hypothetical protein